MKTALAHHASCIVRHASKIALPFALGLAILWWMYRGQDWSVLRESLLGMNWWWMALSLLLGVVPQWLRAWRWQMALRPLGHRPCRRVCEDAVMLSYAASLVVPRIGEVTRCGTLKRYARVPFADALGTVLTERLVDSLLIVLITLLAFLLQVPQFLAFLRATGFDLSALCQRFTSTGWWVTLLCVTLAVAAAVAALWRMGVLRRGGDVLSRLAGGIMSLRRVERPWLYWLMSLGIWLGYFLHFYTAFFCFPATAGVGPLPALLIFCVGSFAVLVPTPNGAGPWHFAVKTMLVLYGVCATQAIMFALVVHTLQTAEVVLLGCWGSARLMHYEK